MGQAGWYWAAAAGVIGVLTFLALAANELAAQIRLIDYQRRAEADARTRRRAAEAGEG